jgi:glutathione synthase/RimK-type ligase-like ATP-grasp enzyme
MAGSTARADRRELQPRVLLCWESNEVGSWNPVLAELLRERGAQVTEIHDLTALMALDLAAFDVCLPRFRVGAAHMSCLDDVLVSSGIPMLNSRDCRRRCENKALAHLAFERRGLVQPRSFVISADGLRDRDLRWAGETLLKPLYGNRSSGIEILETFEHAVARAAERREDLLVQEMIWPARCWRVAVGRTIGIIDPYWREPPAETDRILSISTGSRLARGDCPARVTELAAEMLRAVDGDLLAVDILDTGREAYALEINHNFDAHGGDAPAAEAFAGEIAAAVRRPAADGEV